MTKVPDLDFVELKSLAISPKPYNLLKQEKQRLGKEGSKATCRELADKAIEAAYGGGK